MNPAIFLALNNANSAKIGDSVIVPNWYLYGALTFFVFSFFLAVALFAINFKNWSIDTSDLVTNCILSVLLPLIVGLAWPITILVGIFYGLVLIVKDKIGDQK